MKRPTTLSEAGSGLLTCLLITGSEASHEVAATMRSWCAAGFLLPFLVVELPDVHGAGGSAPIIRGRLLRGRDQPVACDALRVVAQGGWRSVLVLALIDADAIDGPVADPHRVGAMVGAEMLNGMPMEPDLKRRGPRRLTAVRLFAPTSDSRPFPLHWADHDQVWDHSLVLAPEDRQEPDSIADHVRLPGNYASHTAGALAALGGLWFGFGQPGLPEPPDPMAESGGIGEASVQVVRVQNRVAAVSTPLEPITFAAIAVAEGRDTAPEGARYGLRRVSQATSRVLCRRGYQALRDHESRTLYYNPLPPAPRVADVEIGTAELFNNYWRFIFGHRRTEARAKGQFFGALWEPFQRPWVALRRWIDRTLHRVLQGDDTGRRFRTFPALPHEMALAWTSRWEAAAARGRSITASTRRPTQCSGGRCGTGPSGSWTASGPMSIRFATRSSMS